MRAVVVLLLLFPVPPKLTDRQKVVYLATEDRTVTALEAGMVVHAFTECKWCVLAGGACQYAEQAGREVLKALARKGLLRRDRQHVYRRADAREEPVVDPATSAWPEGF